MPEISSPIFLRPIPDSLRSPQIALNCLAFRNPEFASCAIFLPDIPLGILCTIIASPASGHSNSAANHPAIQIQVPSYNIYYYNSLCGWCRCSSFVRLWACAPYAARFGLCRLWRHTASLVIPVRNKTIEYSPTSNTTTKKSEAFQGGWGSWLPHTK